jgi:hypothetical protein
MEYPADLYCPALVYYSAFFATAWWDGATRTAPIILLAAVCAFAGDPATADPAAIAAASFLTVPVVWGARRRTIGPADAAIVFALGLRYGITDGARATAYGFAGLAVVASLLGGRRSSVPASGSEGTAYPLIPALLAGDLLVAGGGI